MMSLFDFFFGRRPTAVPGIRLGIEVTVAGDLRDPTASYKLVSVEPAMAIAGRIVAPNGDVDLSRVQPALVENVATELTFQLVGEVSCGGSKRAIAFRRPACRAFNVRKLNGGRVWNGVFRAFFPDPRNRSRLAVFDRNDDGREYKYCLQIVAPGCRGHGKLDPSIINR